MGECLQREIEGGKMNYYKVEFILGNKRDKCTLDYLTLSEVKYYVKAMTESLKEEYDFSFKALKVIPQK